MGRANGYLVAEVRFEEDARFIDLKGQIISKLMQALGLENWVVQQGIGPLVVHDGGPNAQVQLATQRAFVSTKNVGFMFVNPKSVNDVANKFSATLRAFESALNFRPSYLRLGARSLRLIPTTLQFEELVHTFHSAYVDPRAISHDLYLDATIEDVGYHLNFKDTKRQIAIRTKVGPMSKEQALSEADYFSDMAGLLEDVADNNVFVDLDYIRTENMPKDARSIGQTIKTFFDDQERVANSIVARFGTVPS